MPSNLQDVIVMPSGGGKTTLCRDSYYLDLDMMYSLNETDETYDRMNEQLRTLAIEGRNIPLDVVDNYRERIAKYDGEAKCLLVHSLDVARLSGLCVKGVLLPTVELHEESIASRVDLSKYIARLMRETAVRQCEDVGVSPKVYSNWIQFGQLLDEMNDTSRDTEAQSGKSFTPLRSFVAVDNAATSALPKLQRDCEAYLVLLLSSALGCKFAEYQR